MMYMLNPATGKWSGIPPIPDSNGIYASVAVALVLQGRKKITCSFGVAVNSKGIGYWADSANRLIGEMDPVPEKQPVYDSHSKFGPARLFITPDDQIWFGERNPSAQKIGVLDVKTKTFREWDDHPVDRMELWSISQGTPGAGAPLPTLSPGWIRLPAKWCDTFFLR